ncbi:radical activating enzyme [Pragia fontium]|uniref:Radical activating enzyme n=1 Tax=Pragia fontium TaxID=82985 RepID=A0ABQ5LJE2_9GAMM|nr:4Fe-4S single cluster domain-containing protein [Pragia fontium]GKX63737.1 radical activating enzyme [Pragia fontium]
MDISLSRLHFPVTTLGPGKRIGIWTQGCTIRCPGCISQDTWRFNRDKTPISELLVQLHPWLQQADGITISGGEPFDQPEALAALLTAIRQVFSGDILVFSGYPLATLSPYLQRMPGLIDALMSEPFEQQSPQTMRLRGSDNQQLHLLTEQGQNIFRSFEQPLNNGEKMLDLAIDERGTVSLIGIPRRDDLQRLHTLLEQQGHQFTPIIK